MNFTRGQQLMINSFIKSKSNSSISIQLKPTDYNLVIISFSHFIINKLIIDLNNNNNNESYYSLFRNMNQTNNYKGIVSFGIRELNETQFDNYCLNNQTNITIPPLLDHSLNFTSDFSLRYYSL